ncbi:phage tail tape measure protein [Bacillus anthracis]|uniref:phage tail tape measure protein n=1 Tax=Bacillus anthracis TaxID=1392 RepID=UPI0018669673|nr:phage tail tape measure protein [Bacillus anthracis]MBE3645677.1 phage tail tape measure protein [Bacillus anthracis]MCX9102943.1 phage tail tape measure protein [Bacillus anthracis]MDA2124243.1 phage tail tape measure protein [Bacillus cereus]WIG19438.1 phage tail tape measure protein [Bacillus anthracis]
MELFRMFGSIFLRDDELRSGLNRAEQHGQRTTGVLNRGFSSVGRMAGSMGAAVGTSAIAIGGMAGMALGAGAALVGIVSAGANFEQIMSKVAAVSGASGSEMKQLQAQAKELGATTQFSATQAGEGMMYLAQAGFKTGDIMKAMPGMLDLAAAGALDLGTAADIASNIMSGFGLSADKATHTADVLALAASNSNTNVTQMGEAMKYAAGTAHTVGFSMEETSAAIMAMANSGLQGSVAGQAFATSLGRLAKPTKEMRKVMDELNLSFFDQQGKIKPLPTIIKDLEDKTGSMTNQQKSATLTTLFGAEAYKNWAALMQEGSGKLEKNTQALEKADGAAAKMAKTMTDNLKGKWDEFTSALEGLAITIFTLIAPALGAIVIGLTKVVQWVDSTINKFVNLNNYIGNIQTIGKAIQDFWLAASGDRNALVEGYDILTKLGFSANSIQFIKETTAAVQYGIETMKALVSGDWGAASNFLDKLGFSPEQKANIISFVQDVHAQISNFIANVQSLISAAAPVIMGIIGATVEFIKNVWATILPYVMPLLTDVLNFVNGIISQISAFWQQNGTQIVQAVQNAFSIIQSIISFVMPVVMSIIQSTWGAIKDIIQGAVNIIMGIIKFFASVLTGDFSGMWEGIKQIFNGAIQLIWGLIQFSFVKQIFGAVKGLASSFGSTISSMWTTVVGYFKTFVKEPIASVVRMAVDIGEAAMKIKDKLINPIKEAWSGIMGWIDKIKNGVANMFSGIHIPVPKISVNGSLNPTKWASEGLPSFDVKWAANGALIKPGNPTLIGVGDAQGYDETVLPLRNKTFSAIADGIMKHMPMQQPVAVGASNDRPIEVSVNVDGKTIARATARYMDSELESLKRRRK